MLLLRKPCTCNSKCVKLGHDLSWNHDHVKLHKPKRDNGWCNFEPKLCINKPWTNWNTLDSPSPKLGRKHQLLYNTRFLVKAKWKWYFILRLPSEYLETIKLWIGTTLKVHNFFILFQIESFQMQTCKLKKMLFSEISSFSIKVDLTFLHDN